MARSRADRAGQRCRVRFGRRCWQTFVIAACLATLEAGAAPTEALLPEFEPAGIVGSERARQALAATEAKRKELEVGWRQREYECHQRFLSNSCLTDLQADRRVAQRRLREIEVRARQAIRDDVAVDRERRVADSVAERADRDADAGRRRDDALAARSEREAAHRQKLERRAEEDAARARQAAADATQRAERENELARRRADAEARRQQAPANARAQRERLAAHEASKREREERARAKAAAAKPAGPAGATATPAPTPPVPDAPPPAR